MMIKKFNVKYRIAFLVLCLLISIICFINSNGLFGRIGASLILIGGLCTIFETQKGK